MDLLLEAVIAELIENEYQGGKVETREFAEDCIRQWARRQAKKIYRQRWMSDEDAAADDRRE